MATRFMLKLGVKTRSSQGIMLLELLISTGMLLLVILMSFYVLTTSHQMAEESRQKLLALNAASSVFEAVKETPLTSIPNINLNIFVPADLPNGNIVLNTNPQDLSGVSVATVTVAVNWTGPRGRPMSLQMTTMRSQF